MLNREELKQANTLFWNEFRIYMQKTRSSSGRRMNWLNYPSDVKGIYIRLHVDAKSAKLCFDIQPKNDGVRELIWEQMLELKNLMETTMQHETEWLERMYSQEGKLFSRIQWALHSVNFYDPAVKPIIFSFLHDRLQEFDVFYQEYKEILISLVD
jgi:hypothetical protein